jgi:hypothetical protein
MGFYQLLHEMSIFGPAVPATMWAFTTTGQGSPPWLIDRFGIECRPVRGLLVDYLQESQAAASAATSPERKTPGFPPCLPAEGLGEPFLELLYAGGQGGCTLVGGEQVCLQ